MSTVVLGRFEGLTEEEVFTINAGGIYEAFMIGARTVFVAGAATIGGYYGAIAGGAIAGALSLGVGTPAGAIAGGVVGAAIGAGVGEMIWNAIF